LASPGVAAKYHTGLFVDWLDVSLHSFIAQKDGTHFINIFFRFVKIFLWNFITAEL
jgi:hypothetical protein